MVEYWYSILFHGMTVMRNLTLKLGLIIAIFISVGMYPVRESNAQVRVRKAAEITSPIDISGLNIAGDAASRSFRQTLVDDLNRFGWFTVAAPGSGAFRVLGEQTVADGSMQVRLELVRTANRESLLRRTYSGRTAEARNLAHRIHDDLVQAATGRRGIASTTLLMIGNRSNAKEMYWVDADGRNLRQVTHDGSISVAPAWAPDGKRFVYTSFVGGFPDIYLVDLESGRRERIAAFPGLNSSAAFSPDGTELALILSKDGNPELYVRNLRSGRLMRLTHTRYANEASPSWSPDGRRIVYVSDSTGAPHLYVVDRDGKESRRLTRRGRDNVSPDWGPDGRIILSSRRGPHYQLVLIDPDTGEEMVLTSDPADHEDPSWAPDGRHVAFTRSSGGRSAIYMLDTLTGSSVPLSRTEGQWYSAVWSPR